MNSYAMLPSQFTLVYEGEALNDHTMDARVLGTALVAADNLFRRANYLLNGHRTSASLQITAPQPGCVAIDFALQVTAHFTHDDFITARNIVAAIAGPYGLIRAIKWFRGRKPNKAESSQQRVTIESRHGDRTYMTPETFLLWQDMKLERLLSEVVRPVHQDGIDRAKFMQGDEEMESVSTSELHWFSPLADDNIISDEVTIEELELVTAHFETGLKWRFNDGQRTRGYAMLDAAFVEQAITGVRSFSAGDTFACDVRTVKTISETGRVLTDLGILKVHDDDC